MGACASNLTAEAREALNKNRALEKKNAQDFEKEQAKIKLLLLGAGESGKSTLFKQMKIVFGKGFDEQERMRFLPKIGFNILEGFQLLCQAVVDLSLSHLLSEQSKETFEALLEQPIVFQAPDADMAQSCRTLWSDPAIKEAWGRRSGLQVSESFGTFVDRIDTLCRPGYVPTTEELLLCRVRTTGITSEEYEIEGTNFCMFDVGGQKNERKKWIHCFDNVNAIMFVAALSEYDQTLWEEEGENRMVDALGLFTWVCQQSCFADTSILLFLNKRDLFEQKVQKVAINSVDAFSDGPGENCALEDGLKYFQEKFIASCKNEDKQIFTHVTCATDSDQMRFVFDACRTIIMQDILKDTGFMS